jgi:hypothetical protein
VPTNEMIARQPQLYAKWAGGMPGGIDNPLGARALYLFTPERGDTFLRIHGTREPQTIGTAVSNGCTRLVNDQVIDLYERVPLGTRVVLHPKSGAGGVTIAIADTPGAPLTPGGRGAFGIAVPPEGTREPERMCFDVLRRAVSCNP